MTALPKHKTFNTGEIALMNQRALQQQGMRIAQLERRLNDAEKALLEINGRLVAVEQVCSEIRDTAVNFFKANIPQRFDDVDAITLDIERRLTALEQKRGPGRPKGSKNKPKAQPEGEQHPSGNTA